MVPASGDKPWLGHQCYLDGWWVPMHQPGHTGQALEWRCLELAKRIDAKAAISATSWGLGQILGAWWDELGFKSPQEFEAAQYTEAGQLDTMARFLAQSDAAVHALRVHDWRSVARFYNGPGEVDDYAKKLEAAYRVAGGV